MNKSSYIFFNSDDEDAQAMTEGPFVDAALLRCENIVDAVCFASASIIDGSEVVVHIFEDDGESIKPVLTVKQYG